MSFPATWSIFALATDLSHWYVVRAHNLHGPVSDEHSPTLQVSRNKHFSIVEVRSAEQYFDLLLGGETAPVKALKHLHSFFSASAGGDPEHTDGTEEPIFASSRSFSSVRLSSRASESLCDCC